MAGKTKSTLPEIQPASALYIKLGKKGAWETECIFGNPPTLRLGYNDVSHELCITGRWKDVEKQRIENDRDDKGSAARHVNQIREFYEAGNDVLWLAFHGGTLWWCFSRPEITKLADGSKTRPVIGKWSNTDILGRTLSEDGLRGSFLAMQGFRGTICAVKEFEYIVAKINAKTAPQIEEVESAKEALIGKIEALVKTLHWKDFELLVDLIFRGAGFKRVSELGKTQKTIDLELLSPLTNEKISVQVKSTSTLQEYLDYERQFGDMEQGGHSRFFFVVHSPDSALKNRTSISNDIRVIGPRTIASLCIEYGLVEWVQTKAR